MPSACAATLGRDLFSEASRIFKPSPGLHSRLARGTRQLSNASVAVLDARRPILSSSRSTFRPSVPFSMISTEIDALLSAISVHLPNTNNKSACAPLVINVFEPLTMMLSPSGLNDVFIPVASEPAVGSVITSEASAPSATFGSKRFFCSSLPQSTSGFIA